MQMTGNFFSGLSSMVRLKVLRFKKNYRQIFGLYLG
jgi:hypothetical protein